VDDGAVSLSGLLRKFNSSDDALLVSVSEIATDVGAGSSSAAALDVALLLLFVGRLALLFEEVRKSFMLWGQPKN